VTEGAPKSRALRPDELEGLIRALDFAGLPSGDVRLPGRRFFRFDCDGVKVGYGGLEGTAPELLLRSVVVLPGMRGRGHGRRIVAALEQQAAGARLHLLTTTAADFFQRLGYVAAERATAPPAIAGSREFAALCPVTARYMVKDLLAPG
jgi:amino-acid N-acetyltransferase